MNSNKYYTFLITITLLALLLSCDSKKEITPQLEKEEILLSEVIIDETLNISYQLPLNWDEMPASLSEKLVGRINKKGEDEFIVYNPKSYYYNNLNSSLLRIGEIKFQNNFINDSLSIDTYTNLFQKYNNDLEIDNSNIVNNNIRIRQMKIVKGNLLSFKFLFKNTNNEIIQFDFSIKNEDYSITYPIIIASIKSIKLL